MSPLHRLLLMACWAVASCAPPAAGPPAEGFCRVAPDGGPPPGHPVLTADRGIGGTGQVAAVAPDADRGLGGTGIIGVITGIASVCLNGVEVALTQGIPLTSDTGPLDGGGLRAGQVAVIEAEQQGDALRARGLTLRHEVSGPVEALMPDGALRVAGQRVVSDSTMPLPALGEWVSVSGLRGLEDEVRATRLTPRLPGEVLLRGRLEPDGAGWRLGGTAVVPAPGRPVAPGYVMVSGNYHQGTVRARTIVPDPLPADPAGGFAAGLDRLLVEVFAVDAPGGLRIAPGVVVPAADLEVGAAPRRVVVEIRRDANGGMQATSMRDAPPARDGGMAGRQGGAMPGGARSRDPGGPGVGGRGDRGGNSGPGGGGPGGGWGGGGPGGGGLGGGGGGPGPGGP